MMYIYTYGQASGPNCDVLWVNKARHGLLSGLVIVVFGHVVFSCALGFWKEQVAVFAFHLLVGQQTNALKLRFQGSWETISELDIGAALKWV